jgi:hypothetical protein
MKTESRLDVLQIAGLDTLVGKIGGIRDFPKFMTAVMATPEGCTVVLDWSGIELATASYFGETVLPILKMSTAGHLDRYFLLVGLNQNSLDELKLVIEFHELVVLVGDAARTNSFRNVRVLGRLDSPYFETLEAIKASRTASASTLHKDHHKMPMQIGKTGWANRLAYLSRFRLVRKQRVGRELVFQPVYGGDQNGR